MKGLTTVHVNTLKIVSTMFNAVNYRPTFKLMCVVPSYSHVNHPTQPTTEIVDPLLNFRTRKSITIHRQEQSEYDNVTTDETN